jgi:hypothetical protein
MELATTMQVICGCAALFIFFAGITVVLRAVKSGQVFDYIENSDTESQWIYRNRDPDKFRSRLLVYILLSTGMILFFAWIAVKGSSPV